MLKKFVLLGVLVITIGIAGACSITETERYETLVNLANDIMIRRLELTIEDRSIGVAEHALDVWKDEQATWEKPDQLAFETAFAEVRSHQRRFQKDVHDFDLVIEAYNRNAKRLDWSQFEDRDDLPPAQLNEYSSPVKVGVE